MRKNPPALLGAGGNDALFGGDGEDTAVFEGPAAEYRIAVTGGSVTVQDTKTGRDGTDALHDIELLQFSNAILPAQEPGETESEQGRNP